ncbi:MAG: hypothetical protein IJO98_04355, partial [Clostridia bacterium]|nr:hypothetical protein [Clostridia bacterium]
LTKSTLCQTLRNLARQGNKLADKGAYINVSDCRLQVQMTQQAKIPSILSSFEGIFAFAGFVSGLRAAAGNLQRPRRSIVNPFGPSSGSMRPVLHLMTTRSSEFSACLAAAQSFPLLRLCCMLLELPWAKKHSPFIIRHNLPSNK